MKMARYFLCPNYWMSVALSRGLSTCLAISYTIADLIDIGPEMVKIWISDFEKKMAQIIADYVYFHMVYHTFIWNHCGCHRRVLNMTHFQLFAWFGKILLVKKIFKKSEFLLGDTIGSKFNFKWSTWVWTRSR